MIKYNDIVDYNKINFIYSKITGKTKHKKKLINYEFSKFSNFIYLYDKLKNKMYFHGRYNIFLIREPKHRIIMSENLNDKIVNHLVSHFILFPLIDPLLLETNVATRVGKGLDAGLDYVKNYLNKNRNKLNDLYVLKCDIEKYFYNIDHDVLLELLKPIICDNDIYNILKVIISSTDEDYVNNYIDKVVDGQIDKILKSTKTNREKNKLIQKLKKIPRYRKGKGLPIGNMSSQIFAIFYLNELDHFIVNDLGIKYYVRYMDDFLLFHENKEYLKYCKNKIEQKLVKFKLILNKKTSIMKLNSGFVFLGYRFCIKNNKVYMLSCKSMKKKIKKRYKKEGDLILNRYNGYLLRCSSNGLIYNMSHVNR